MPLTYMVRPGDTLAEIAADFDIEPAILQAANPALQLQAPQSWRNLRIPPPLPTLTPLRVQFSVPSCYELVTDVLVCLGEVHNPQRSAVARVTGTLELRSADGSLVATGRVQVEQAVIPPGSAAPYRVLFPADVSQTPYNAIVMALHSADAAVALPLLTIEQAIAQPINARYRVSAHIRNPGSRAVNQARLVVTLYDGAQRVVGYRIAEVGRIAAGDRVPAQIDLLPLGSEPPLSHSLYAEAR
ncbi:MAG: LysM peptidoglycan-binding domain-containing protein [Armatimonadetes bacterium]|nr:LysM peptidoglycan-binding domain-containing protein [Anaerolineae bacterium]